MTALRSILFAIVFYVYFAFFLILFLPFIRFSSDRFAWEATQRWGRSAMRLHRFVVGASVAFEGLENVPAGPSIIASKHQSYWETLAFTVALDRPAFILKKELMRIPLFGPYMRRLGMIPVDRTRRGATMNSMMEGARRAASEGRPVVIFPEGTRTQPGATGDYRPGVFMLYAELGAPIVPVALNSGVFWPRRTGPYRGGTIRVAFLPPIMPGMARPDLLQRLKTAVETKSRALLVAAYRENPRLPVTPPVAAVLSQAGDDGGEPGVAQA